MIDIAFDHVAVGDAGLERTQVRRALRRQAAPFEVCFQREGTADVAFLISPAGGVQRPIVSEKDSTLSRCLAAALARVTFPRSDDAAVTEVTVTVHVRRRP